MPDRDAHVLALVQLYKQGWTLDQLDRGTEFRCEAHTNKTALGWWIANETPINCEHCDQQATWVLVRPEIKS